VNIESSTAHTKHVAALHSERLQTKSSQWCRKISSASDMIL